jgi:hypothetical protein
MESTIHRPPRRRCLRSAWENGLLIRLFGQLFTYRRSIRVTCVGGRIVVLRVELRVMRISFGSLGVGRNAFGRVGAAVVGVADGKGNGDGMWLVAVPRPGLAFSRLGRGEEHDYYVVCGWFVHVRGNPF